VDSRDIAELNQQQVLRELDICPQDRLLAQWALWSMDGSAVGSTKLLEASICSSLASADGESTSKSEPRGLSSRDVGIGDACMSNGHIPPSVALTLQLLSPEIHEWKDGVESGKSIGVHASEPRAPGRCDPPRGNDAVASIVRGVEGNFSTVSPRSVPYTRSSNTAVAVQARNVDADLE